MANLTAPALHALVSEQGAAPSHHARIDAVLAHCAASPHCLGLALVGSFAKGLGDRISDLDLVGFVEDGHEAAFMAEIDERIGRAEVLNAYGQARAGQVAFRKYVYLDFSSCEFHAFTRSATFRLRRPYLSLWDPQGHLATREVEGEPPRHETFQPYPHGDEGLVWELVDCVKWLQRGRTELAKSYLARLGAALGKGESA